MTRYIEDYIAVMISDVIDNKYNIYIDPQLSNPNVKKRKGKISRPDIILYKKEIIHNEDYFIIYGLFEIKAQLGYSSEKSVSTFIRNNEKLSKLEYLNFNIKDGKSIKVRYAKNYKDAFIILTSNNSRNFINYINHDNVFCFYNKDSWYDKASSDYLYIDNNKGMKEFIEILKKI